MGIPSLRDLAIKVIALEIDLTPGDYYIKQLRSLETEYLNLIFKKLNYISLEKFHKSGQYKDAINYSLLKNSMKETEDHFRHLFAVDRSNPELDDEHLMLIDVFDNIDSFQYHPGEPEEAKIPRVFPLTKKETSGHAIVSQDEFLKRFSLFTENQLDGLDWSNVFVAGGSVLASLSQTNCGNSKKELRDFFHRSDGRFAASDIDLFIYGLSPDDATKKLDHIHKVIAENNPNEVLCVRTAQSVSIVSQYPYRHVQIILRLYKSPAEVLMGFDLDCVTVGFDGKKVWALPRFYRAITRQYNLVDLSRRSTSYEFRLHKYSQRGFEVAVPGLDRNKLNPVFLDPGIPIYSTAKYHGLAKLLALERTSSHRWVTSIKQIETHRALELTETMGSGMKGHDYSITFLPWGKSWNAQKISGYLRKLCNSQHYNDVRKKYFTFGSTIDSILYTDSDYNEDEMDDESNTTNSMSDTLPSTLKWLTVEPGRQYIGSFHPEDPSTWEDQAYSDAKLEMPVTSSTAMFSHHPPIPTFFHHFNAAGGAPFGLPMPVLPMPVMPMLPLARVKPVCKYGANCYRKNPDHFEQFDHPWKNDN